MKTSRSIIAAAAAALLLGACMDKDPQAQIASAKEYLAKNDTKAAAIEVKTALQTNPDLGEARHVLGTALMAEGNPAAAEVEFRKALAANFDADQVIPQLAKAMLALGQAKKLTDEFGGQKLSKAEATADFMTSLTSAWAAQGKQDEAFAALSSALAADPSFAPARLASALRMAVMQDFAGAMTEVEGIVAANPTYAPAWKLKADLLAAQSKPEDGIAAYRTAIEVDPKFLPAHFGILTALLKSGRLDEAAKQMEDTRKVAPQHLQTRFFEAQIAFARKDFKTAREIAQQLVRVGPNSPLILQLAGAVELQMNSPVQAEIYLTRALQAAPGLVLARRLLVASQLRSGQAAKALETLNAGMTKDGLHPALYSVAGDVYLLNGNAKKAEEYFSKAVKLNPESARNRTALALSHMATGQATSALEDLQSIAESDSGSTADMALISTHVRRKEFDKALAAIDRLEAKQPGRPFAANLRGRIQLTQRDLAGARKSFERALSIDPTFYPAVASLAMLDLNDKKPEEAKKRFESLLAKNPKNSQALVALAQLAAANDAPAADVGSLLVRAVDANPEDARTRTQLIEHHLRQRDTKQALAVAQAGAAAAPNNPDMLTTLARVQQLTGDLNQAISTYGKVVTLQPLSPQAHARLAEAQIANKDLDGAEQSLRKALELKPDMLEVQVALVGLSIRKKNHAAGLKIAKSIQEQRPKAFVGYAMEGDVAAAQSNVEAALTAYRSGLKQVPDATQLASKIHAVLLAAKRAPEADRFAAEWANAHPKDAAFHLYLGDSALARKDLAGAEKAYAAVIRLQPNHVMALNNLAWVGGELGRPGALAYAEKAINLAPQQPAFLDTAAMLLAQRKEYPRALELQNKAVALAPGNHGYRLNLAKILLQSGDKTKAKTEFETLAKLGDKFPAHAEVTAALKGL